MYNVANAVAAIAIGRVLGLPTKAMKAGLVDSRAAFGRQETISSRTAERYESIS